MSSILFVCLVLFFVCLLFGIQFWRGQWLQALGLQRKRISLPLGRLVATLLFVWDFCFLLALPYIGFGSAKGLYLVAIWIFVLSFVILGAILIHNRQR